MNELTRSIILAITGISIGYLANFFIAKYNARFTLKSAIADTKVEFYMQLWKLCNQIVDNLDNRKIKYKKLKK